MRTESLNITDKVTAYKKDLKNTVSLILRDDLPKNGVDVIFYHGRSFGDDNQIIDEVAKLLKEGKAKELIVYGNDGQRVGHGFEDKYSTNVGKAEVARKLDDLGIDILKRVWFSSQDSLHTRSETKSYFDLVLDHGWKKIGVIAHPHQLPRIMLGTINELNSRGIFLPVYSTYPDSTNWEQIVYGSQGAENKPRKDHAFDEIVRIPRYQKMGHLATFEELTNYYNKRGGIRPSLNQSGQLNYEVIIESIDKLTPSQIFPE